MSKNQKCHIKTQQQKTCRTYFQNVDAIASGYNQTVQKSIIASADIGAACDTTLFNIAYLYCACLLFFT